MHRMLRTAALRFLGQELAEESDGLLLLPEWGWLRGWVEAGLSRLER